jgi:hypothetical protein
MTEAELVRALCFFIRGMSHLHSSTIRAYIASIRRTIFDKTRADYDFLDVDKNSPFCLVRETLNSLSKSQKQAGVGFRKKQAEYITVSNEVALMDQGSLVL